MPEALLFGHPTAWRVFGSGARRVLALHCSLAHGGEWAGVAAALPDVTLIAPDLPGHGRSADWDGTRDIHDLNTRIALELLGEGPMDVIGHSFGATVALRLGLERPDAVRSLTLIEPVLFAAARAAGGPAFPAHAASHAPFDAALAGGDTTGAAALFHRLWGNGQPLSAMTPVQQDYIVRRIGLIAAQGPALNGDSAGLLAPWRLEGLGLPVLLLEGGASPPVVAAIMEELARRLPMAHRVVVPGAGHMLPLTHTGAVAAAIANHMSEAVA